MFRLRLVLVLLAVGCLFPATLSAQRTLAPGALKIIAPHVDSRDGHSVPMPMPGVDAEIYDTTFFPESQTLNGLTEQVIFYRDVWQYEFAFLGLRQMVVEVPAADGSGMVRKNIWYMVYRIRNTGASLSHRRIEDTKYDLIDHEQVDNPTTVDPLTLPDRFFGDFVLQGWVYNSQNGEYELREYNERVAPNLVQMIQQEEDPDRPLLDKVQLAMREIARVPADSEGGGLWGVAVWTDVEPKLDFVSVKVSGLTNAYRIQHTPEGEKELVYKKLRLNFWRPGDQYNEARDRVVFGIPLVDGVDEQKNLAERYLMPGPMIRGEQLIEATQRRILMFETDGDVTPRKLDSRLANELDRGELPAAVELAFRNAGVTLAADYQLSQRAPGTHWQFDDTDDSGAPRTFLVELAPIFWDKKPGGGLRFLKRLDHFWFYE